MKFQFDTLKCAKMLVKGGMPIYYANVMVESLSKVELNNICDRREIEAMLSETVQKVFDEFDSRMAERRREFNERAAERRREFNERAAERNKQIEKDIAEGRSLMRWLIGTVITCTLALAGYLSALIHLALPRIH